MRIKRIIFSIVLLFPVLAFSRNGYAFKSFVSQETFMDNIAMESNSEITSDCGITIVGENIPETGITSAYLTNFFSINSNGKNVTDFDWKLEFPLKGGGYGTFLSSNQERFSVPALSEIGEEYLMEEGELKGFVIFSGMLEGQRVDSRYSVTFEFKPLLVSAEIIKKVPCEYDGTYYDAWLDVYYNGCTYVHVDVYEEGSGNMDTYFSNQPLYTQFRLRDIDSLVDATVTILLRNDYGFIEHEILLPKDSGEPTNVEQCQETEIASIDVYTLDGVYKMSCRTEDELRGIAKGMYILKYKGRNNEVLSVRKIAK